MKESLGLSICNTNGLMASNDWDVKWVIKALSILLTFLAGKINHDSN